MKFIITGGCGFIGYNFATRLAKLGHQVVVADNLGRSGAWVNLNNIYNINNIKFLHCDIRNDLNSSNFISELEESDMVFHLAGQVAVTKSIDNPDEDFAINAIGTFKLLEAIRKSHRRPGLIFSSTNKVYGGLENHRVVDVGNRCKFDGTVTSINEDQNLDFHSPYGCSKGAADQYVRDYARVYGLKTVIFRQSCIYGENQYGIEDQGWVAWMTIAALLGKKITIYGDGRQVRDLLHVEDLFNAFITASSRLSELQGEVFNMGGGEHNTLSILELLAALENKLATKIDFTFEPTRQGDQKIYVSDISKANKLLEWTPKIQVSEGLDRLINWSKDNLLNIRKILHN